MLRKRALKKSRALPVTALILGIIGGGVGLWACSVPVFRYALEQWPADYYRLEVLHKGPLSEEAKKTGDLLTKLIEDEEKPLPLVMRFVDLEKDPREGVELKDGEERMLVHFPLMSRIPIPAWTTDFTEETLRKVVSSPVRTEIAKRLMSGDTAVWIFMPCGDKEKDEEAEKVLRDSLKEMEENLELPPDEFDPMENLPEFDIESNSQLRIAFPVVTLDKNDPKEEFLVASLMRTEEDLQEYVEEPMAFPVFGQGRCLYAVLGKGINERNIGGACMFLTGPCSCQVKDMNPGVDILFAADWRISDEDLVYEELELPPLSGLGEGETTSTVIAQAKQLLGSENLLETEKALETGDSEVVIGVKPATTAVEENAGDVGGSLLKTFMIMMGSVIIFISFASLIMRRAK